MKVIDESLIYSILPKREQDSNKGDYGKVLNITGSQAYIGAGMLSALAALKVGAGYSMLCSDEVSINSYKNASYDLIYKSHGNFDFDIVKSFMENQKVDAVVFGCGIGVDNATIKFTNSLLTYLKEIKIPAVVDADGLNCLSKYPMELGENFIITPHPKELSHMVGFDVDEIQSDREKFAAIAQEHFKATVILKGYNTLIATNGELYKNKTGTSALSKAGTGDVLAGVIGGFLAQGVSIKNASILAVYIHGLAAEFYTEEFSEYSMLASDLLEYIPVALREVCSNS